MPPPIIPPSMPTSSAPEPQPRLILYAQTHHTPSGSPISLLPLLLRRTGITHLIVAAFHINERPDGITLNDDSPTASKFDTLWAEVAWLRGAGVKVLGMLGGAAKGSYERLSGNEQSFETYYQPLRDLLLTLPLDGLDLDIEEPVPLTTPLRLLRRLRADFGASFLTTLAPTATALLPPQLNAPHLSGFSYAELEAEAGALIAWYNAQFYCGWGHPAWYPALVEPWPAGAGWAPEKVVLGLITSPANGAGFVDHRLMRLLLENLRARYPRFGGVMGWEYFNAEPGGEGAPWVWAEGMASAMGMKDGSESGGGDPAAEQQRRDEGSLGLASEPGAASVSLTEGAFSQLLQAETPFPGEHIQQLVMLGFDRLQAVAALNATNGHVEQAVGLLFGD